jgi:hypothetical protein
LGAPSAGSDAATKTYVDTVVGAISTSSVESGNSNITVTDTGTGTITVTVDGNTALTVDANGVTVAGNFTVSGTTTTVNSNTVSVADNILTLNSDATGAPSQNAGLEVERGDEANVQLRWNEGSDTWTFTNNGAQYYPLASGTDDLAEGSTNQYFTTARARGAISSSSSTGVSYNSSTGTISLGSIPNSALANNSITINGTSVALGGTRTLDTDSISEGSNKYFTDARAVSANASAIATAKSEAISAAADANAATATKLQTARTINGVSFDGTSNISFSSSAVSEGSNLYFTDARARNALGFTAGSGAYNSSTGVITIPTNTNQLTNGAGFITGYTETDTLASVTGRGASTTAALSTGALTVSGGITATGEITAYYSDDRLKKDVTLITEPIKKLKAIRGVTFRPNDAALALGIADKDEVGVIAQEVRAVLPQLVTGSAFEGYITVKYEKLTALLIEAVKAQQLQIEALQADVSRLRGTL